MGEQNGVSGDYNKILGYLNFVEDGDFNNIFGTQNSVEGDHNNVKGMVNQL